MILDVNRSLILEMVLFFSALLSCSFDPGTLYSDAPILDDPLIGTSLNMLMSLLHPQNLLNICCEYWSRGFFCRPINVLQFLQNQRN